MCLADLSEKGIHRPDQPEKEIHRLEELVACDSLADLLKKEIPRREKLVAKDLSSLEKNDFARQGKKPSVPSKECRRPIIFHSIKISTKTQFKFAPIPLKNTPSPKLKNTSSTTKSLFTGIVEEVGKIRHLGPNQAGGIELRIAAKTVLGGIQLGDSISVNGTCLTVSDFDPAASHFSVGLSPETLRKTSLGELGPSSPVNLERALQPTSRMGGHIVQGHVDGTGEIVKFEPEGNSLWVMVKTSPELLRYIVPKGFISVDGASLTVVRVYDMDNCFDFMLVEYTQQKIVIPMKKLGDKVNLEVDILGKYVERLVKSGIGYGVTSDAS